jgi:hypothetical protein
MKRLATSCPLAKLTADWPMRNCGINRALQTNTLADHSRYHSETGCRAGSRFQFNPAQHACASGLALRFPRIKAIRRDKNVDSIDTLQYARRLAAQHAKLAASFGSDA